MIKFSIIIPIYNVEKYLDKCLNSLILQTYTNFEAILINDGSKENEFNIVQNYLKDKRFSYFEKENGGLSDARNYGLDKVTGDYLLFLDSDDYYDSNFLEILNNDIDNDGPDLIKFGCKLVNEEYNVIEKPINNTFIKCKKKSSVRFILKDKFIDPSCFYAYKISFWKRNDFRFVKDKFHEDFGLTPIIISKAESIVSIDNYGYNYLQRNNSIMSSNDYQKVVKKVIDFKDFYLLHKKTLDKKKDADLLGYSSFALICKSRELNDDDKKEIVSFIKKEKLVYNITSISFKRFLMKLYLMFFLEKFIYKKKEV